MAGKSPTPFNTILVAEVGPDVASVATACAGPVEVVVGGDLSDEGAGEVEAVAGLCGTELPVLQLGVPVVGAGLNVDGDVGAAGAGEEDVVGVLVVGRPIQAAVARHRLAADGECVLHRLEHRRVVAVAPAVRDACRPVVPRQVRLHARVNPRIAVPVVRPAISKRHERTCISRQKERRIGVLVALLPQSWANAVLRSLANASTDTLFENAMLKRRMFYRKKGSSI